MMLPDPHSLEAKVRGCTCPRQDPGEPVVFRVARGCPLHGDAEAEEAIERVHRCEDCGELTGGEPPHLFPYCGRCLAAKFIAL